MTTITEDYVSFETAKLLKEKGFDEGCHSFYDYAQRLQFIETVTYDSELSEEDNECVAPTHQMAMAWLREVHNIVISIYPTIETDVIVREDYNYAIYKNKTVVYQSCSTSYEEAVEASLKYVLEKLI